MAFMSFIGRVLFVSFFVVSAWQEFIQLFLNNYEFPQDIANALFSKRYNEFGSDGGPATKTLMSKLNKLSKHFTTHTGFQAPDFAIKVLVVGAILLKGIGSFLFIFGSTTGALLLYLHQLIVTPILYDFYNYEIGKKAFTILFIKFTQNLALIGGLMFFIGMNASIQRRLLVNKKAFKSKRA